MAFSWLINGDDPNHLLTGMMLQVDRVFLGGAAGSGRTVRSAWWMRKMDLDLVGRVLEKSNLQKQMDWKRPPTRWAPEPIVINGVIQGPYEWPEING